MNVVWKLRNHLNTFFCCLNNNNFLFSENGSRCTTPNGESSICRSIYQCATLLQVVKTTDSNQLKFLRESQCGYDTNPLVCCGSLNNYRTAGTTSRPGRRTTLGPRQVQLKNSNIPDRTSCGFQVSSFCCPH